MKIKAMNLLTAVMIMIALFTGISVYAENRINPEVEMEKLIETILKTAPSGIGMVENRVIVMVNDYILELLGYTDEELLGQEARILYPDDEEHVFVGEEKYRQISLFGTGSVETRWITKDGRILDVILSSTPLNPDDLSVGVIFTVQDITASKQGAMQLQQRTRSLLVGSILFIIVLSVLMIRLIHSRNKLKESESKLRESEERFIQSNEQSRTITWETDGKGLIMYVNEIFEEILGYGPDEVIGLKTIFDVLREDDRDVIQERTLSVFSQKESFRSDEIPLMTKTGGLVWVMGSGGPVLNPDGSLRAYRGNYTDISERKKLEEELRVYMTVSQQSIDGLCLVDLDGYVVFVNESWAQIHGYLPEELKDRHLSIFHTQEQLENDVIPIISQAKKKGFHNGEVRHVDREGNEFPTWMTTTLVKDADNKPFGMFANMRDITEKKKVERELIEAKHKAEDASIAKSQFLANMSHEIRTPMNGLFGFMQLMYLTEMNEEQKEYLDLMFTASEVLMNVIDDILIISKVESGRMVLNISGFNLQQAIESAVNPFAGQAKLKGVVLEVKMNPEACNCQVMGDSIRLRQIISNLVSNAIKFTDHGNVTVQIDCGDVAHNRFRTFFKVTDTGIGMTKNVLDSIAKPFVQGDSSINKKYGGTGLGLAISKAFVEMMGGELVIESKVGDGTSVSFEIELEKSID